MKIENITGAAYNNYIQNSKAAVSGNDFITACKQALENSKEAYAASAKETVTEKLFISEPSYTVTETEAEYFRGKYGEEYNEEKAAELYYELAEKGIISINDAARSSGTSVAMPLSAFNSITYFGGGDP